VREKNVGNSISLRKLEANRRNAQLSTGPRTEAGRKNSRRNALKHGVLADALLISEGEGAEDAARYHALLDGLYDDLQPVGAVEEMLVERIAVCWWRQKRALQCEAGLIKRSFLIPARMTSPEYEPYHAIKDHLSLPLGADLDRILRYETTISASACVCHESTGTLAEDT
jgi:hypothetical protein